MHLSYFYSRRKFESHSLMVKRSLTCTFSIVVNLAKGKQTYQSSEGWGGKPDRAVDGNVDPMWASSTCSHTLEDKHAWFAVDLGEPKAVKRVAITNRGDCCCKFVWLSVSKFQLVIICTRWNSETIM
jgi:hypothetical protein